MPELPEVETVRRGLVEHGLRAPIDEVWRGRQALRTGAHWRRRDEHLRRMVGLVPDEVRRRGKHIVWTMREPSRPRPHAALLIHLGMTGRVQVRPRTDPRDRHTHAIVRMTDGRELRYVDARRFGGLRFDTLARLDDSPPLRGLGPEPLDVHFDGEILRARAGRSRRTLRAALLDQAVVAGVGNIYALEAAFAAGVDPRARCHRIRASAWDRVAHNLREILTLAIEHGGTTSRDFVGADGRAGSHQESLRVYGRGGQPCRNCGTSLDAFAFEGRGAVRCSNCQPRPIGGWVR